MKGLRRSYFAFTGVLLLAALITGRREFFLLFFMLAFVALYAFALNLWTFFSFTFVQELPNASGKKGGIEHINIRIHNDKPFPFTLMKIQVETAVPSENTALRFNLSPMDSIFFEVPLYCAYRGEFEVGMTVIDVSDIFGLFTIRYDLRVLPYYRQRKLKIYPRIVPLRFLPAGTHDSKLSGGVKARAGDSGDAFSGPRKYRPGDALRQIHWPASARARELISKSYETPAQESVAVAIDNSGNGLEGEALLQYADLACECACAIARYYSGKNRIVRLVFAGAEGMGASSGYKSGRHGFPDIYNTLAVLPFNAKGELSAQVRSMIHNDADLSAIYVFSHKQDEKLIRMLAEYVKAGLDAKYFLLNAAGGRGAAQCGSLISRGIPCSEISFGDDIAPVLEGSL